jgi:hypothetical protein
MCVCEGFFQDRVLQTICLASLELLILQPQPPQCWDYRHVPPSLPPTESSESPEVPFESHE